MVGYLFDKGEKELVTAEVGEEFLAYEWMGITKGEQAAYQLSSDETEGLSWDAGKEGEFIGQGEVSRLYSAFVAIFLIGISEINHGLIEFTLVFSCPLVRIDIGGTAHQFGIVSNGLAELAHEFLTFVKILFCQAVSGAEGIEYVGIKGVAP